MEELKSILERIAIALETIAASKTPKRREVVSKGPVSRTAEDYLKALRENADELSGRMEMQEIAFAIGMPVTRSDQVAIGRALTEFGAAKGKSGSARYYLFG